MNNQQISKIRIKGYKSIKECNLNMGMINVFIGTNGAGKSNFISVFKFLQDVIEKQIQWNIGKSGGPSAILYNGPKVTDVLELRFEFGKNAYELHMQAADTGTLIFESEYFFYKWRDTIFTRKVGMNSGYLESNWEVGTQTKYDKYVQPILNKQKWRLYHFHDTSSSAKIKQQGKIVNNAELAHDAGNVAAFLYRIKKEHPMNYNRIVSAVRLIAPYFDDFYLEPIYGTEDIKLNWKQNGTYDIFSANQFSDGTIRFICLATLLLQPEELQPESIVIDEPELGLHPYAITLLGEIIHEVGVKKQIILSTQSVELLNQFDVNEVVVVNRESGQTSFHRLDEEELSSWLEEEYSLGELWKKNVIGGRF